MSEENPVGRPPHVPTDESRELVSNMVMSGIIHETIAKSLKICVTTLVKHYEYELETARAFVTTKIGSSLVQDAYNGDMTAKIFYLKTRGGWNDKDKESNQQSESENFALRKT